MKNSILAVLTVISGIIVSAPAFADGQGCLDTANKILVSYGVTDGTLRDFRPIHHGQDGVVGYSYWYTQPNCPEGSIVVQVKMGCTFIQIYSQDDCHPANIPHS